MWASCAGGEERHTLQPPLGIHHVTAEIQTETNGLATLFMKAKNEHQP